MIFVSIRPPNLFRFEDVRQNASTIVPEQSFGFIMLNNIFVEVYKHYVFFASKQPVTELFAQGDAFNSIIGVRKDCLKY